MTTKLHNFKIDDNFSFNTPEEWEYDYPSCGKGDQSPINISTDSTINCNLLCELALRYKPVKCFASWWKNVPILRFNPDTACKIKYKNNLYNLDLITIHTPSLHLIDNEKYDVEICLWHNYLESNPLILSCLFQEGENSGDILSANTFMKEIIDNLPKEYTSQPIEIGVSDQWSPSMVIPNRRSFYTYDGSFTIPPCNYGNELNLRNSENGPIIDQNITWIVFEKIESLSNSIIESLKFNIGNNSRPVQDIKDRMIYYNPNVETAHFDDEKTDPLITNDNQKFLKCVKKGDEIYTQPEPEDIIDPIDDSGLDIEIKKKIQKIFYFIIILLLLYSAVVLVKIMFETKLAKKILNNLYKSSQNKKVENPQ